MYISKRKNGYGWYSKITVDNVTAYLDFVFKQGCEPDPQKLNDYGSLEGDLIFRDRDGCERKVWPKAKLYMNKGYVEFVLLEEQPPIETKGYESGGKTVMKPSDITEFYEEESEEFPW